MEIRLLAYFLAEVQEENLSRAAEVLHVTQPMLSRQMAQLEEELGTQLFIRSPHLTLTDSGVMLQRQAEEVVPLMGKLEQEFAQKVSKQTMRYSELHKLIPKATDKMLAQQIRELEHDGIIHHKVYPVVSPKTKYSLTEFGQTFTPITDALCSWGQDYLSSERGRCE